jgi:hypothetical protein
MLDNSRLKRFRPLFTFYNGDIYQDNARQNTVRLFIKFNHNDNAWQYTIYERNRVVVLCSELLSFEYV